MKLIKTLWGVEAAATKCLWDAMFAKVAEQGFQGVEICSPNGPFYPFNGSDAELKDLLAKYKLKNIIQIQTLDYPLGPATWQQHAEDLRKKAEHCTKVFGHDAKADLDGGVAFFNVHGGKDSFKRDDALRFYEEAVKIEKDVGVKMVHETHRQRVFHNPFVLRDLKDDLPKDLKLNADLSHFVVSLERLMCVERDAEFWPEVLDFLCERTDYIHARVGYSQGIQVPHPAAPEHFPDVEAHLGWWKTIGESMESRGVEPHLCPEFGPYPYMPHLPFSKTPVADLDEICFTFGQFLKTQCAERKEGIQFQR